MRADSQVLRHPDQIGQRIGTHFAHDVPAMKLDRVLSYLQFGRNLLVQQGELELYERKGRASYEVEPTLAKLQFTGELDLLNDRPSLLNCRAARSSRVLRISRESVRTLMRTELDIAELILNEWMIRRARLVNHRQGGIIVVGDSLAAETMRIERFLIGNGHPHQLIDSNQNLEAEVLLRALDVESDQLPVVFFSDGTTLRKPANTLVQPPILQIAELPDRQHVCHDRSLPNTEWLHGRLDTHLILVVSFHSLTSIQGFCFRSE